MEMQIRRGRGRPRKNTSLNKQKAGGQLGEIVLNNKVLRIHLYRENLDRLRSKKVTRGIDKYLLSRRRSSSLYSTPVQSPKTVRTYIRKKNSSSVEVKPEQCAKTQIVSKTEEKSKPSRIEPNLKTTVKKQIVPVKASPKSSFKIKLFPPKAKKNSEMKRIVNNGKIPNSLDDTDEVLSTERLNNFVKIGQKYILKFPPPKPIEEGKLGYDFHSLVADVKTLQLPGPTWKIKVIIKHNRIAALIFTNKQDPERSVSFNSDSDRYSIVIDNKPVILLASPPKVCSSTDIEVLLNILENIKMDNPMILFK